MVAQYIHRFPLLRLLLPLIAGIILSNYFHFEYPGLLTKNLLWLVCLSGLFTGMTYYLKVYRLRWLFGLFATFFFLLSGMWLMEKKLENGEYNFPVGDGVYMGYITEEPEEKEKTILCNIHLTHQYDSVSHKHIDKNVLLYFPKDSAGYELRRGDRLFISAGISPPANNGNPDEFDYKRYLHYRGISGIGFVRPGHWQVTDTNYHHTLKHRALDIRANVLEFYRTSGFRGDDFSVLAALTVGYKDELSEDIRESYSVSGAAHVLALSGLHVGFIYTLLLFLLRRIPGHSLVVKLLRTCVVLICLWGFAFITGLSATVVRAVLMCSLFALSELRTGNYI